MFMYAAVAHTDETSFLIRIITTTATCCRRKFPALLMGPAIQSADFVLSLLTTVNKWRHHRLWSGDQLSRFQNGARKQLIVFHFSSAMAADWQNSTLSQDLDVCFFNDWLLSSETAPPSRLRVCDKLFNLFSSPRIPHSADQYCCVVVYSYIAWRRFDKRRAILLPMVVDFLLLWQRWCVAAPRGQERPGAPLCAAIGWPFSLYNSDGVWRPRVAKSGLALPSARLVSINIVPDVDAPSELGKHLYSTPRTVEARCNK